MEDALAVHVVNGYEQLVHVELDFALLEVVAAAADELVQVDVHELEDERESAGGLVLSPRATSHAFRFNDCFMSNTILTGVS